MNSPIFVMLGIALLAACGTSDSKLATPIFSAPPWRVGPLLQNQSSTSVWIVWEDNIKNAPPLKWGKTTFLRGKPIPTETAPEVNPRTKGKFVHKAQLTGLDADTVYYYQVNLNGIDSAIYHFNTQSNSANNDTRFAVYSDTQRSGRIHRHILEQGVTKEVKERSKSPQLSGNLDFILVPGDLVHDGAKHDEYKERFFDPASHVAPYVPYYPAIGNHEYQGLADGEEPIYLDYFELPANHVAGYEKHWYSLHHNNIHIISLNTNKGSKRRFRHHPVMYDPIGAKLQINWLKQDIEAICHNKSLPFIFVQFHHPVWSEMWVPGHDPYTQEIAEILAEIYRRSFTLAPSQI